MLCFYTFVKQQTYYFIQCIFILHFLNLVGFTLLFLCFNLQPQGNSIQKQTMLLKLKVIKPHFETLFVEIVVLDCLLCGEGKGDGRVIRFLQYFPSPKLYGH